MHAHRTHWTFVPSPLGAGYSGPETYAESAETITTRDGRALVGSWRYDGRLDSANIMQNHQIWVVVHGRARVEIEGEVLELVEGSAVLFDAPYGPKIVEAANGFEAVYIAVPRRERALGQQLVPAGVKPGRPYAPGIGAANGMIFVSGQGAIRDGKRVVGSVYEETTMSLENVEQILREGGADRRHIVNCRVYLASLADVDEMDSAYRAFFGTIYPTRTTVGASLLRKMKVEIDAIAVLSAT